MNLQVPSRISIETFEAWAEKQDGRYELVRGRPVMMNETTRNHSKVTTNLVRILVNAINPDIHHVAIGDFGLKTGDDTIRLADIMVTGADGPARQRGTDEAILLVEILSPSTANDDFGDKQREYLALSSLHAYLIVAQDAVCVWAWIRGDDGFPKKPEVIEMRDGAVTLPVLGVTVTLETIYRNVEL
jgi:Uma2 family endonuclease